MRGVLQEMGKSVAQLLREAAEALEQRQNYPAVSQDRVSADAPPNTLSRSRIEVEHEGNLASV